MGTAVAIIAGRPRPLILRVGQRVGQAHDEWNIAVASRFCAAGGHWSDRASASSAPSGSPRGRRPERRRIPKRRTVRPGVCVAAATLVSRTSGALFSGDMVAW